jgi:broad specificity phosphatase PhoE
VLLRHGATEANLAKCFLSSSNPSLGERGKLQCASVRDALAAFRFERCLVSPLQRCLQTRELVVPQIPYEIEPALREVDFGGWEGKTLEWAERNAPELLAQRRRDPVRFRPPGGESIEDAALRLRPLAEQLRDRERTLVVAHRLSLGILERLLRGLPLGSKHVVQLEPAEFRIVTAT